MDTEAKADFTEFILHEMQRSLSTIHPRAKNRTETKWWSAVTVDLDDGIVSILRTLNEHNILCCPVTTGGYYEGVVDVMDILGWVVDSADQAWREFETVEDYLTSNAVTTSAELLMDRFKSEPVRQGYSIWHAFELMARRQYRRITVIDSSSKVTGIITQSMLIGELYNNMALINETTQGIPVSQITGDRTFVTSVRDDCKLLDAFRLMSNRNIGGIAILDQNGVLVDSLSVRDLRGVGLMSGLGKLQGTVKAFKDWMRTQHPLSVPSTPVTLTPTSTLREVITAMEEKRVHRIFVVDEARRPTNIITQTDVIAFVLPFESF